MKKKLLYITLIAILTSFQSIVAQSGGGDVIRGRIVSETGEELISATVLEIDKTNRAVTSTLTDMNGDFSMRIKSPENKLRVSYLGYHTHEASIAGKTSFQIVMKEQNMLQEVVIQAKKTVSSGSFTIPEREVGFAMQRISSERFEGLQVNSIDDALQGEIAGLDILGGGDVGKRSSMRIRGISSINGDSQPLIVVNGIPREDLEQDNFDYAAATEDQWGDLLSVNPDDIQDIEVLKDAGATAMYGSKGANGVIKIITKRGSRGPTRVNYTYKFSGKQQPKGLKMLNGDDYSMLMKQANFNPSLNTNQSNIPEFNYDPTFSEYQYYNNNTDWRDAVIQNGYTHDHNIMISGGGEKALFRISAGYMTSSGTIIGQNWDRLTSRVDLDYYVSDRILFRSELAFTYSDNDYNWGDDSLLDIAYKKMPNLAIYNKDEYGNDLDTYYAVRQDAGIHKDQREMRNPVALGNLAENNTKKYEVRPVFRLRYDFLRPNELTYDVYVSFGLNNEKTHKFLPRGVTSLDWSDKNVNRSEDEDKESFAVQTSNEITWQPIMEDSDHSFHITASFETATSQSNSQKIVSYGHPAGSTEDASSSAYLESITSGEGHSRSLSLFSRFHYVYKGRYVLGGSIRRDGSTRFGRSHKWGNFPGLSAKWIISDESFMEDTHDWLDILAIRSSFGVTGRQPGSSYMHFSKYAIDGNYAGYPTIKPENIRLSDLRWEKKTGVNVGLDVSILNKYTIDFNVYRDRITDMLMEKVKIPSSTGFSELAFTNAGTMDNKGWELSFNANRFFRAGDFSMDFRANFSHSVNTLVQLDEDILNVYNAAYEYENGTYLGRIQEGKAYGSIYGFRYKGVYQYSKENHEKGTAPVARNANGELILDNYGNPLPMYFNYGENGKNYEFQAGDAIYEDINHDGNIDELDIVYLGNSNPKFNGGAGLTLRYKTLSCNIFTTFRYGNKIVNKARMNAENMYGVNNQSIAVNWRWRKEGDVTNMPRALYNYGYNWLASDRYVEDGSFLRLKYVTLNYALPAATVKKWGGRQMNFYLTVNNLFCLTKYQGVDPEISDEARLGVVEDKSTTPRSKDFTLGVTIGF